MTSQDPYPSPPPSPAKGKVDPILRNALRYTISAKEYKTFHKYLITRSPAAVRKRAVPPTDYASLVYTKDDFNGATIRASLRVFVVTQTSLKLWESIKDNLFARGKPQKCVNDPFLHGHGSVINAGSGSNPKSLSSNLPTSASPPPSP